MPTRDQRQRANDAVLLAGVIIFCAAVSVMLAAVAGLWTPPGWTW